MILFFLDGKSSININPNIYMCIVLGNFRHVVFPASLGYGTGTSTLSFARSARAHLVIAVAVLIRVRCLLIHNISQAIIIIIVICRLLVFDGFWATGTGLSGLHQTFTHRGESGR